jgi:dihydrofolate reductase
MIAAIDSKRGIADDYGIPWDLPKDKAYFRSKTEGGTVVMGYRVYLELVEPLPNRQNLVLTDGTEPLRSGFEPILDLEKFLSEYKDDLWIIGGAVTYQLALPFAEELYLTKLTKDFACTKFFPSYESDFVRVSQSGVMSENDIQYRFCAYRRK